MCSMVCLQQLCWLCWKFGLLCLRLIHSCYPNRPKIVDKSPWYTFVTVFYNCFTQLSLQKRVAVPLPTQYNTMLKIM